MKSSSERDRILTMFLPAILVVFVYGLFIMNGRQKLMTAAYGELDKNRAKAPSQAVLMAKQAELTQLSENIKQLKSKTAEIRGRWDKLMAPFAQPKERNHRVDKLHVLLENNSVVLLNAAPAESSRDSRNLSLSPSQERLLKMITEKGPANEKPQLYRVELAGRYLQVLGLLQELSEGETVAVPLGLGMKQDEKGRQNWTLLLWI